MMFQVNTQPLTLAFFVFLALQNANVSGFDPPSVFPTSVREALASKSKAINPQQYSPRGWSNRAATALTPQHPSGVYTADRPFYWNNIDVSCRCTVIEMENLESPGSKPDLWVHSPVGLDGPLQQALDKIGRVKYVVSPNYEHVKFANQWDQAYDCDMWACPGLQDRMPNVKWKGEIPYGFRPKGWKGGNGTPTTLEMWDIDVIQPLHFNIEVNPFTRKPFFNEVIFYHSISKALIVTDLFWNYPASTVPNSQFGQDDSWELAPVVDEIPVGSRLWKFGMDNVYGPFFKTFMVQDKSEYHDIVNHILNVWDVELLIPAHGDLLRGKDLIRKVLISHFGV